MSLSNRRPTFAEDHPTSPAPSSTPQFPSGVPPSPRTSLSSSQSSAPTTTTTTGENPLLVDQANKWKSWKVRFWTTWAMLGVFSFLAWMGHICLVGLVITGQTFMYMEIASLAIRVTKEQQLPYFRFLSWYWFFTAIFFTYGRLFIYNFGINVPYHSFISFCLFSSSVVLFVFSLKKGHYKYQFGMFGWCHLTLLLIVVQSSFLLVNMYEGLIWFLLPALLIVSNDVWAYFFGFFWGRTPLIQLSPKKTWEGFLGGFIMTLITGFLLSRFLSTWDMFICPQTEFFTLHRPSCDRTHPFVPIVHVMPKFLSPLISSISISPVQWHGLFMAFFASLIAPFGGFFASGFKRAFKIKDFGDSIPGHGGVTDRMDCQIMMSLFVFVYYSNFIRPYLDTTTIFTAFLNLQSAEQLELFAKMKNFLIVNQLLS